MLQPNARGEPPLEAEARHERRLLAVACRPMLDAGARRGIRLTHGPHGAASLLRALNLHRTHDLDLCEAFVGGDGATDTDLAPLEGLRGIGKV